jgi:hypothetical protein
VNTLDSPRGRPGLRRANTEGSGQRPRASSLRSRNSSTSQRSRSTRPRRNSQPITPPTFAERVELGPPLNPWHKDHPHRFERNSIYKNFEAREEQRRKEQEHRIERLSEVQRRRSARQLDGSRSAGVSPTISRTNSQKDLTRSPSFKDLVFGPLKRSNTGNSIASSRSEQSTKSRRSFLCRIETVENNDRDAQGHEARKERQLREPGAGADGEPDPTSHTGQGIGGLPGKHSDKSTRYAFPIILFVAIVLVVLRG